VLYIEFDSSIGGFHTFPNYGNYHDFSFPLNGATMPPRERRNQVNYITFLFSFSSNQN
jgi:hypothetical protein